MMKNSFWINSCKKHLDKVKRDCKKRSLILQGWTPDADRRSRCDIPNCKERAYYECFIGKKSWGEMIKKGKFVSLDLY